MQLRALNEEVLVAEGSLSAIGASDIAELKAQALATPRRRIRICAHSDTTDPLHEMLIVHMEGAYVRPHKHLDKSESVHVIEGEADAIFFDDEGVPQELVPLGPYSSSRRFYYRLQEPVFHTLLIATPFFVMHEATNGPFRREQTVFAPWAPAEDDEPAAEAFRLQLSEIAAGFRR